MATAYIAGPMRGYQDYNFPAFDAARDLISSCGIDVISPADLDRDSGIVPDPNGKVTQRLLRDCLGRDIVKLVECDLLVLLQGWRNSRGAIAEHATAIAIGIPVVELTNIGSGEIMEIVDGVTT